MIQFIASYKESRTDIHLSKIKQAPQESLSEFVKKFYLILDLKDVVVYTGFLNGLKDRRFKFSLAKQKETSLAEALKNAADFMRVTEIYTEVMDGP